MSVRATPTAHRSISSEVRDESQNTAVWAVRWLSGLGGGRDGDRSDSNNAERHTFDLRGRKGNNGGTEQSAVERSKRDTQTEREDRDTERRKRGGTA